MREKQKKTILIFMILLLICAIGIGIWITASILIDKKIKTTIADNTDAIMNEVKNGLTEDEYNRIAANFVKLISDSGLPTAVTDRIADTIDGDALATIHPALTRYMEYEIVSVEKINRNHYQETIRISNINTGAVIQKIVQDKIEEYKDKSWLDRITGGVDDIQNALSGNIPEMLRDSITETEDIMVEKGTDNFITKTYTIDFIKTEGKWAIDDNTFEKNQIIQTCLGIPVSR